MYLRAWRESAGMTQQELANSACVSQGTVSHVENGRYKPSARFADKVCKVLSNMTGKKLHRWEVFPEAFANVQAFEIHLGRGCGRDIRHQHGEL